MSLARFLTISIVATAVLGGLAWGGYALLRPQAPLSELVVAIAGAFVVGTGGWLVALQGVEQEPRRMPMWLLLGMVTKGVLAAFVITSVAVTGVVSLNAMLPPFAIVFVLLGLVQVTVIARYLIAKMEREGVAAGEAASRKSDSD